MTKVNTVFTLSIQVPYLFTILLQIFEASIFLSVESSKILLDECQKE